MHLASCNCCDFGRCEMGLASISYRLNQPRLNMPSFPNLTNHSSEQLRRAIALTRVLAATTLIPASTETGGAVSQAASGSRSPAPRMRAKMYEGTELPKHLAPMSNVDISSKIIGYLDRSLLNFGWLPNVRSMPHNAWCNCIWLSLKN
jgi:hypothetical protein